LVSLYCLGCDNATTVDKLIENAQYTGSIESNLQNLPSLSKQRDNTLEVRGLAQVDPASIACAHTTTSMM
jgi:hypothetical protein